MELRQPDGESGPAFALANSFNGFLEVGASLLDALEVGASSDALEVGASW